MLRVLLMKGGLKKMTSNLHFSFRGSNAHVLVEQVDNNFELDCLLYKGKNATINRENGRIMYMYSCVCVSCMLHVRASKAGPCLPMSLAGLLLVFSIEFDAGFSFYDLLLHKKNEGCE
jgi:hypothetical protein